MWTRRTLRWLLPTTLASGFMISAIVGYAAGADPALVSAAKSDDVQAVRTQLAKRVNVNEPSTTATST